MNISPFYQELTNLKPYKTRNHNTHKTHSLQNLAHHVRQELMLHFRDRHLVRIVIPGTSQILEQHHVRHVHLEANPVMINLIARNVPPESSPALEYLVILVLLGRS